MGNIILICTIICHLEITLYHHRRLRLKLIAIIKLIFFYKINHIAKCCNGFKSADKSLESVRYMKIPKGISTTNIMHFFMTRMHFSYDNSQICLIKGTNRYSFYSFALRTMSCTK